MLGFMPLFVSPAKAGAQEPRWCRCHSTDLSAVGLPPARCLSSLEKQHPPCRRTLGGPMSFWLPPRAPWSLGPGLRRENEGEESGGPGAAMVPLPQNGPQRSGFSAGTVFEFIPLSFPPRKRGPRSRDDAAATERTSAHWALRRHDARVLLKRKGKRKRWLMGTFHPPT